MKSVVVSGYILAFLACQTRAETFNGVEFPSGAASFADAVLRFDPNFSGGPPPAWREPQWSLGPPAEVINQFGSYQALGSGGLMELLFGDNLLANDGTLGADLYVGEVIGTPEDFFVALRPTPATLALLDPTEDANGDGYFELGRFVAAPVASSEGFVIRLDIDRHFPRSARGKLRFDAIQFMDDPTRGASSGNTVGFDLESVGAIASVASDVLRQTGDTDEDGDVDLADLNNVRNNLGVPPGAQSPPPGDSYPYDGSVDLNDLNNVRNNLGAIASATSVPEPSALLLVSVAAANLLMVRRALG